MAHDRADRHRPRCRAVRARPRREGRDPDHRPRQRDHGARQPDRAHLRRQSADAWPRSIWSRATCRAIATRSTGCIRATMALEQYEDFSKIPVAMMKRGRDEYLSEEHAVAGRGQGPRSRAGRCAEEQIHLRAAHRRAGQGDGAGAEAAEVEGRHAIVEPKSRDASGGVALVDQPLPIRRALCIFLNQFTISPQACSAASLR